MARAFGQMSGINPNPVGNTLANWLYQGRNFANKAEVPYLGGLGDLLFGESPEVIEDWAYGFAPVSGAGQTTQLDPRLVDVAGLPLPYAGAYMGGKGLYKGMKRLDEALSPNMDDYAESLDNILREGYGVRKFGRRGHYPAESDSLQDIENRLGYKSKNAGPETQVPKYNYFSGRTSRYQDLDAPETEPLFVTKDQGAVDYYSGAAWGDEGAAVFPFEIRPKKILDVESDEGLNALQYAAQKAGIDVNTKGWRTGEYKSPQAYKDIMDQLYGSEATYHDNIIDLAYIPEIRAELRKLGYDAMEMKNDFLGDMMPNHDTLVPLKMDIVKDLTGKKL